MKAEYTDSYLSAPESWSEALHGIVIANSRGTDWEGRQLDADAEALANKFRKSTPKLDSDYKRRMLAKAITLVAQNTFNEVLEYLIESDEGEDCIDAVLARIAHNRAERDSHGF